MPFHVHRHAVPTAAVDALLRRMWIEFRHRTVTPDTLHEMSRTTWWPHLRDCPEVLAVQDHVHARIRPPLGRWAEPQLLIRFPNDPAPGELVWHVDETPPWALPDERYSHVCGVALTPQNRANGAVVCLESDGPRPVAMSPGDILDMDPATRHCSGLNLSPEPRVIVYYRHLVR